MCGNRYSLVTVFHAADVGFAEVQAASVRRFLPCELVDEIIVIANGEGAPLLGRLRNTYGSHPASIQYVKSEDLLDPEELGQPGWWSQQALKLKASGLIGNSRYLVLDAKNHFTRPVERSELEADGLPRLLWHSYAAHPMRGWAERTLTFFGLSIESHIAYLPQSTTPFAAYTRISKDALNRLNYLDSRPTAVLFRAREISEFLSYGAFLLSSGQRPNSLYTNGRPGCINVWGHDVPRLREMIREASFTFALHKTALPNLADSDLEEVAGFWTQLHLVDTVAKGIELLNEAVAAQSVKRSSA
jgi:hypothetical protein